MHDLVVEGNRVRMDVDTAELDPLLRTLSTAGVRSLTASPPTLEELFLRHYGVSADEVADQGVDRAAVASAPTGDGAAGPAPARPGRHERAATR